MTLLLILAVQGAAMAYLARDSERRETVLRGRLRSAFWSKLLM